MGKGKMSAEKDIEYELHCGEESDQELIDQARRGNVEWVLSLLSMGATGRLWEALEAAAISNRAECVRAILPIYGEPDLSLMERVAKLGGTEALSELLSASSETPEWMVLHLAHLARTAGHQATAELAEARWEADALARETPHAPSSSKPRL